MLTTNKSITLIGHSEVENQQAVYFRAQIGDGDSMINQSIQDKALYEANKEECRKDFSDFQDKVYAIEDQQESEEVDA